MNTLEQPVLVLNKNWQPVDEITVEVALANMCKGSVRGMEMGDMRPVTWEEWITLSVRDTDLSLKTIRGPVRVPRVVLANDYAGMPEKEPKLDRKGVGERDRYRCGYTGDYCPDGNLDHVVPASRGGKRSWENITWSRKDINHLKANRTPEEAGLKLRHKPIKPRRIKACMRIRAKHPDWKPFVFAQ